MRILVAGATGAIGRLLVPRLVEAGHHVTGLARTAKAVAGADSVPGDVFDAEALADVVRSARPDVVIHQLTALGERDFAANTRIRQVGTRNLVDAAKAAGVRRMVAQSISWVYRPGEAPATEDEPLDVGAPPPRAGTVEGVVALEAVAAEMPEWVVLRYGMLYGPGTWFRPDDVMGALARDGKLAAGADVSSFLHVADAAAAAEAALAWPSGAVNVVDDEPAAGYDWVPVFCAVVGAPEPARDDGERHGWVRGASNRHAREDLDWRPIHPSWRSGWQSAIGFDHD